MAAVHPSIPRGLPVVAVLVADRLPDEFTGLDVADALEALRAAERDAGAEGDPIDGTTTAGVLEALTAHELATLVDPGPPAVYRLHRDALPM